MNGDSSQYNDLDDEQHRGEHVDVHSVGDGRDNAHGGDGRLQGESLVRV